MLKKEELPKWFKYPNEFYRISSLNITELDPWIILDEEDSKFRFNGMKKRFPHADLIPFARREDNDDVACWEKSGGNLKVFVIHDYSSRGWENKATFDSFWCWFKQAIDDMIEHEWPYR